MFGSKKNADAHDYVLKEMYDDLVRKNISLADKYYKLAVLHHKNELDEFRKEYIIRKDKSDLEIKQLDEKRAEYKAQMKHGLITNVEYQRLFMDLDKQKRAIERELSGFKYDTIKDIEEAGFMTGLMIERFLEEGCPQSLSEERQMEVNLSYERYRKALIRAAQDNEHLVEVAGRSIYILERVCLDNMINRAINTPIAVAETKEGLIDFCYKMYGNDIPFDENGKTPIIQTPMGEASFQIKTVAWL